MPALHHYCYFGALALAVSQLACQAASDKKEPVRVHPGSVSLEKNLSKITASAGYKLVSYSACSNAQDVCTRIKVETWDEEILDYEITGTPCNEHDENCLGGYIVRRYSAENTRHHPPQGVSRASWQQIPARLETPIQDSIVFRGANKRNPAILVSGRISEPGGRTKRCERWWGAAASSSRVELGANLVGNIIGDNCNSELALFAENGAARLINTESDWSNYTDSLSVSLDPVISVPTVVWVAQSKRDFLAVQADLQAELDYANEMLANSRCGIQLGPVAIHNMTITPGKGDPTDCSNIDTALKPAGYDAGKMNVYVVNDSVQTAQDANRCKAENENVIVLRGGGREKHALLDRFSRHLDAGSVAEPALQNKKGSLNRFSAAQCYRMNFSQDSYLNKRSLRNGPVKSCGKGHATANQCPAMHVEF